MRSASGRAFLTVPHEIETCSHYVGGRASLAKGARVTSHTSLAADDLGSAAQRDRRKRILDAAIALASEGGFDAVQMRAVADRAEVALGTLYRYFPSKVHLLVSALGRELERAESVIAARPVPGDTRVERVIHVLTRTSRGLFGDQPLAEALTRAFMFADESVSEEIHHIGVLLTTMLTRAMHPDRPEVIADDVRIARVIGDVWLSALVARVTGRSTATETADHLETAVRLLLRDKELVELGSAPCEWGVAQESGPTRRRGRPHSPPGWQLAVVPGRDGLGVDQHRDPLLGLPRVGPESDPFAFCHVGERGQVGATVAVEAGDLHVDLPQEERRHLDLRHPDRVTFDRHLRSLRWSGRGRRGPKGRGRRRRCSRRSRPRRSRRRSGAPCRDTR